MVDDLPASKEEEQVSEEEIQEFLKQLGVSQDDGYPGKPTKESLFHFFKHIIGLKDNSKTGNATELELGQLVHSIRIYQDIANYAETENLDEVAEYFRRKANIVLSTGLSKDATLVKLFVTQIKQEMKQDKEDKELPKKKGWFG